MTDEFKKLVFTLILTHFEHKHNLYENFNLETTSLVFSRRAGGVYYNYIKANCKLFVPHHESIYTLMCHRVDAFLVLITLKETICNTVVCDTK